MIGRKRWYYVRVENRRGDLLTKKVWQETIRAKSPDDAADKVIAMFKGGGVSHVAEVKEVEYPEALR